MRNNAPFLFKFLIIFGKRKKNVKRKLEGLYFVQNLISFLVDPFNFVKNLVLMVKSVNKVNLLKILTSERLDFYSISSVSAFFPCKFVFYIQLYRNLRIGFLKCLELTKIFPPVKHLVDLLKCMSETNYFYHLLWMTLYMIYLIT